MDLFQPNKSVFLESTKLFLVRKKNKYLSRSKISREIQNQFSWQPRDEKTEFFQVTVNNSVLSSLGCQENHHQFGEMVSMLPQPFFLTRNCFLDSKKKLVRLENMF